MGKVTQKPDKRGMPSPKAALYHIITKVHNLRDSMSSSQEGKEKQTPTALTPALFKTDLKQATPIHFPVSKEGPGFSNSLRSGANNVQLSP